MKSIIGCAVAGLLLGLAAGANAEDMDAIVAPYARDLVVLQGDKLVSLAVEKFPAAPVTILYFSAGWCPDCRKFSPKLVEAYKAQGDKKDLEVLFVSRDKTEQGMLKFMKDELMPWPAVAFSKVAGAGSLNKLYSGKGIPCLTVINRKGEVLKQSASDQDAAELLKEVLQMLGKK